jgi:hypothetical protein
MEISIKRLQAETYSIVNNIKEPIILTNRNKKVAILSSYSPEEEMYQEAVAGHITWDDYREKLVKKGFEQLEKNPGKISPAHVIAAEGVEIEKSRVRLQEVGLRMVAAKLFAGLLKPVECPNCHTKLLPEGGIIIDDKYLRPQLPDSTAEEHRAVR